MRCTISKKDLEQALSISSKAISPKSPLPILSHFLFRAETGNLKVSATDLEIGIECSVKAQVIEEGSFTTPARTIQEIVNLLPDEDLQLLKEREELVIKSSASEYKLMTLSPDEYPIIPRFESSPDFVILQKDLRDAIRNVAFAAASQEETRAVLTGILVLLKGKSADFIATDGRRLAKMKSHVERSRDQELKFIIPGRTLVEISKFLRDPEDRISVSIKGGQVLFEMNTIFVLSRILEGKYPEFGQVIPESTNKKLTLGRQKFLMAIKRALIMAQEKQNPRLLKLQIKKDKVIIRANTPDLGSAYEEVPAEVEGGQVEVAFNGQYFMDVLTNIQSEKITFELTDAESPSIIKVEGNDNYLYVLMPVRIREEASETVEV
jgi:DNA polymerase III subunit beta